MAEPSLSDRMLVENASDLAEMTGHRFVRDIARGSLPRPVFDRYLLIEGAFVETAIAIFGYAVAKASDLADRRKLIESLDALANVQMPYFETAFARRGLRPDPALQADPGVTAFRAGMLAIARDCTYADIITTMFAAEWMYWIWCSSVQNAPFDDPMVAEWVAMHADADFAAQAKWLRARVDRLGTDMTPVEQNAAVRMFGHVQRLETAFHHAAYS